MKSVSMGMAWRGEASSLDMVWKAVGSVRFVIDEIP